MALPEAKLTIKDGALGIVPANTNGIQAIVGVCSAGTVNEVRQFGDVQALKDAMGTGPLVEQAAHVLSIAGGPVICVRVSGSVAGTFSAVALSGTGASVLTLTGSTPLDSYQVQAKIIQGAANPAAGLATFRVSLDGGLSFGPETTMPTSGVYAVSGTGLTLTFSAGTLVANDVYSFSTVSPGYAVGDLNAAIDALLGNPAEWFLVNVVGVPADGTAFAAVFAALDSKLTTAENTFRYAMGLMSAPDISDAALITAGASLSSTRVAVGAGFANITSSISGSQLKRSASFLMASRAGAVPPSEDLGRVASGPARGALALLRDEMRTPGLDAQRFSTLRTHVGLPGFYITNGKIFSTSISDFQYIQHRRVMDIASKTVRLGQLRYLNDSVRVNAQTGLILESDAKVIDAYITGLLRAALTHPGFASEATAQVDRSVNILSTNKLVVKYRVIPLGYLKAIEGEIGFFNPALQPA